MKKEKREKISEILDCIDEKYIAEAAKENITRRSVWLKVGTAAACLTLAVTATAVMLPAMNNSEAGSYTESKTSTEAVIEHATETDIIVPGITDTEAVSAEITEPAPDTESTTEAEKITSPVATDPAETPGDNIPTQPISPMRPYKDDVISSGESAIIWTWDAMTAAERYRGFTMNGCEYTTRASEIGKDKLGKALGEFEFTGYDIYTDSVYTETFAVYGITGIKAEYLVAAELDGAYTVFRNANTPAPSTLGELMDTLALTETLPLKEYSFHSDYENGGYFALDNGNEIWDILEECKDAPLQSDDTLVFSGREVLSFTATSEELGIYKKVFSITRDGYVSTNIAEYGYVFFIGEDAAERIFDLAISNSTPAEAEPYYYSVAGIVTEIGDGYVLIDDSSACENRGDGIIFKVDTTDPAVGRYVTHGIVKEGSFVYVSHRGKLTFSEEWLINDVVSIADAILTDDGILTLE